MKWKAHARLQIGVLAVGMFAIGSDAYVIAGVLGEISQRTGVSVSAAGQLITMFALAYAIGSPAVAVFAVRVPRRKMLCMALVVFTFGNVLAAAAPTYGMLAAARVITAIGAATYAPNASLAATALAPARAQGRALAVVMGGFTAATVIGVPAGTYLGSRAGYNEVFLLIAALGAIALIGVAWLLPYIPSPPSFSFSARAAMLRTRGVSSTLVVSVLAAMGAFSVYSYISPLMHASAKASGSSLSMIFAAFGVGGAIGTALSGWMSDRWGANRTAFSSLATYFLFLAFLPVAAKNIDAAALDVFCWGVTGWLLIPAQQHRLIGIAPDAASLLLSLNASAMYFGIGSAAAVGGLVIDWWGIRSIGLAGAGLSVAALIVFIAAMRQRPKVKVPGQARFAVEATPVGLKAPDLPRDTRLPLCPTRNAAGRVLPRTQPDPPRRCPATFRQRPARLVIYSFSIIRHSGFGEVLRGHRRAARLTLEQLAEVSGVSARTLSDMERGRSKGPQHRTVTALADALALEGDTRKQLVELARDGRLRDHWTRPAGLCELPRLVDDFTGRAAELVWMSELVYAESAPGAGVVGLITGSGGMGKTTLAIRAAHVLRPNFPGGVFFLDLFGMSQRPAAAADALRLLLRALGLADEQIPGDVPGRASVYRSLLRDRHALVVLDNAGSEEQVRPLLPGDGASRALITARRLLAGLEGVRRLALGPLSLPEATELMTGILGQRAACGEESALNQLAELCEGMPLALRIIGNRLVSRPGWDAAELAARLADEEHRLDQFKAGDLKIATAFGMSYEQLADAARRVFRRLAVVPGRDFDAALAAVVGEVPVEVAWDALDELVDLGLLLDSAAGRYRFHDLVRLFARTRLEEEESPAEREALTARVTSWLLRMATMAGRWFEPGFGRPGLPDPDLVVLSCAEEAENWLRANVDNWLSALRSAADRGQHSAVVDCAEIAGSHQYTARAQLLLGTLAALLAEEGRTEESRRPYARAAQVYEAIGDAEASSRCHAAVPPAP